MTELLQHTSITSYSDDDTQHRGGDRIVTRIMDIKNQKNGRIIQLKRIEHDMSKSFVVADCMTRVTKMRYTLEAQVIDTSISSVVVESKTLMKYYYYTARDSFNTLTTKTDISEVAELNGEILEIANGFGLNDVLPFELACLMLSLNEPEILSDEWMDDKIDGFKNSFDDCTELRQFVEETALGGSLVKIWAISNFPEGIRDDEYDGDIGDY